MKYFGKHWLDYHEVKPEPSVCVHFIVYLQSFAENLKTFTYTFGLFGN